MSKPATRAAPTTPGATNEVVASPQALVSAVLQGVPHIQVTNHLDLRLPEFPWFGLDSVLGNVTEYTKTITVRRLSRFQL